MSALLHLFSPTLLERARTPLDPDTRLYHGTASSRLGRPDGSVKRWLVCAACGNPLISFSTCTLFASYWSGMAVLADQPEHDELLERWLFSFRLGDLLDAGHFLTHFSDPVFGIGECDEEQEIACWTNVDLAAVPYTLSRLPALDDAAVSNLRRVAEKQYRAPSRPRKQPAVAS